MNHPRPDHERSNDYDVELSDPVYENVMVSVSYKRLNSQKTLKRLHLQAK